MKQPQAGIAGGRHGALCGHVGNVGSCIFEDMPEGPWPVQFTMRQALDRQGRLLFKVREDLDELLLMAAINLQDWSEKMISIEKNANIRPISASRGGAVILASVIAIAAALWVTSAYASYKQCSRVLGQCQSACAKRPIGQDVCYKRCERSFMNCD